MIRRPPVVTHTDTLVPDTTLLRAALEQRFLATEGIGDGDTSVEAAAAREVLAIGRERAARLGVSQAAIANSIAAGLSGHDATFIIDASSKYPRPIRLRLPPEDQATPDGVL